MPLGLKFLNPYSIRLLNTTILLSSGFSITWAHFSFQGKEFKQGLTSLIFTIGLALIFIFWQGFEYSVSSFNCSDSVFGSIFYLLTGFHGFHVLVGLIFLLIQLIRAKSYSFSSNRLIGFEFGVIYWHFVDLV